MVHRCSGTARGVRGDTTSRILGSAGNRRSVVIEGVNGHWIPEALSPDRVAVTPRPRGGQHAYSTTLGQTSLVLIQVLPAMALVCLVLAGLALRLEGGSM